eukprot:2802711-Rhodomonas_salina.1
MAGGVLVRLLAPSLLQALPGVTEPGDLLIIYARLIGHLVLTGGGVVLPGIAPRMVVGGESASYVGAYHYYQHTCSGTDITYDTTTRICY